jgi:hypothetical protein
VKTEILGTIDLLDQQLASDGPQVQKRVVLFSNSVEEDDTRNFIRAVEVSDIAVNVWQRSGLPERCGREQGSH